MDLLERESILVELEELLRSAAAGSGRVAVIAGEAGIGKTTLVEHFCAGHADARVLRGLCDPFGTPRPLGPVHDMTAQSRGPLATALRDGMGREALFSAFLAEITAPPRPVIVVVEDVHWADDATLDLLCLGGRRIRQLPALMLVTYREEEIGPDHLLRKLLGELPHPAVRRLRLPLLSERAVAELARRSGRDAAAVFALTGGNPFFVTEVLASPDAAVPASIREAVLARATHLPLAARAVLDVVSVSPGRVELRLLEALFADAPTLVRACVAAGVLVTGPESVGFRHELARLAWQASLEPGQPARLHARILEALLDRPEDERELARIVHHADGARDGARVLHFAPAAAREAARMGAHRQVAEHYATALRHAAALGPGPRAELLEAYSYERHLVGGIAEAIRARQEALALRRALDDRRAEGVDLRWLSRLAWFEGRQDAAVAYGHDAIAMLEPLGPTPELAMAYSNLAQLHMLADDAPRAVEWGERAIALAEEVGDAETLTHALSNVGTAELYAGRTAEGDRHLERSVEIALAHGFHEHAVRAYGNVACNHVRLRLYERADASIARTLRFAEEHEIETWELYLLGWRARLALERGDWPAAERDAIDVTCRYGALDIVRFQPLIVLALLQARRGDAERARGRLDEALAFALPTGELQRIGPAVSACAEAAWLRGDLESVRDVLDRAWEATHVSCDRWGRAQLAWWRWRAGGPAESADAMPEPFRLQCAGDWRGAADAWEGIGAPYERALALAAADAPDAWADAIATFEGLGATATVAAVRRDLQRRGARGVPRGPREATRDHPAGLTSAQVRVLRQLARGLSNGEIARELGLSTRTVDHHVSAILQKLDVTTRAAAIAAAHERRLVG